MAVAECGDVAVQILGLDYYSAYFTRGIDLTLWFIVNDQCIQYEYLTCRLMQQELRST